MSSTEPASDKISVGTEVMPQAGSVEGTVDSSLNEAPQTLTVDYRRYYDLISKVEHAQRTFSGCGGIDSNAADWFKSISDTLADMVLRDGQPG